MRYHHADIFNHGARVIYLSLLLASCLAHASLTVTDTGASANTANAIVKRDGSGNFSAGTVTAALTGTASGNLQATANQYGVLLSGSGNTASVLAPDSSTHKMLHSGGSSANPTWGLADLTADVTGLLPAVNGGVNTTDSINNCSLSVTVASSAMTVALKDSAGSDPTATSPCMIAFRNATAATGTTTIVSSTAATSLVVSNGSAVGCQASVACTLYIYAVNNAGTIVLGIINGTLPDEGSVTTSTALAGSGADDSIGVLYTTATQTSKAVRLIGRITITPASAFAWTNAVTETSMWPFRLPTLTPWVAWTPTGSWTSNVTWTGFWRRNGDSMEVDVKVTCSGAPTSAALTFTLPGVYTVDTTKITVVGAGLYTYMSSGVVVDSGSRSRLAVCMYNSTTAVGLTTVDATGGAAITQAVPITFGNTDYVQVVCKIPITGWAP